MFDTQANPADLAGWIAPWEQAAADREEARREQAAQARRETAAAEAARAVQPVETWATEAEIRDLARRRARYMLAAIADHPGRITRRWLVWTLCALEANPLPELDREGPPIERQIQGFVKRATCRLWWRRQLRRAAGRKREAAAQAEGAVSKKAGAPYVTNETALRYVRQQADSRAMLERTYIVSEDGEEITLAAAFDAGTGNRAIRRGELMTRIKGAEAWAAASGTVGEFATLTTPSRFHSTGFGGNRNRKWNGSTPRDGQKWLCTMWARVRAKLARRGLGIMGFRIAEPHHDGTPHWHALWWATEAAAEEIRRVVREYWLSDEGDEPGAEEHRVKFERINPDKGGACAYLAKYIAKNIDDAGAVGTEGHRDEAHGEQVEMAEAGGAEGGRYAGRVAAWASVHGIRQFQALGQPPVSVWRELRRIKPEAAQGVEWADNMLAQAMQAVHRDDEKRASWADYMELQGGALRRRQEWRLTLETKATERLGQYGETVTKKPVGVRFAIVGQQRRRVLCGPMPRQTSKDWQAAAVTYPSNRKEWRPRQVDQIEWLAATRGELAALALAGRAVWENKPIDLNRPVLMGWAGPQGTQASAAGAQPWTRLNNCTHRGAQAGTPGNPNRGPGGRQTAERQKDPPPWTNKTPNP